MRRLFAVIAVVVLAFGAGMVAGAPSPATDTPVRHLTVQPGDSWFKIADRLVPGQSQAQRNLLAQLLAVENGGTFATPLYVGEILVYDPALFVQPPAPTTTTPATTTVPATTTTVPGDVSNFDVSQYVTTGGPIPASSASDPSGNFRTICHTSHYANDDPIVYPGQPGKSHLHMFFGNTLADANSTYTSLRTTGNSTCQGGPVNRTGYWIPALLNKQGQPVDAIDVAVYYKDGAASQTNETVNVFPAGFKMIAGQTVTATIPTSQTHYNWFCTVHQVKAQTIPASCAGEQLEVQIQFPNCWDGINLDSPDHRAHLRYYDYSDGSGKPHCPTGFATRLPEVTLSVQWAGTDHTGWVLSSDMGKPAGSTFHADWFGAWDPGVEVTWVRECINARRNCIDGELGDGRKLTPATKGG